MIRVLKGAASTPSRACEKRTRHSAFNSSALTLPQGVGACNDIFTIIAKLAKKYDVTFIRATGPCSLARVAVAPLLAARALTRHG